MTVLITDMEGSTEFTEGLGDAVAMELIRVHEQLVRDVVGRHGGREIKSMGDGFMVAFTTPAEGVSCALDIHEVLRTYNDEHPNEQIRVRMGLNTGVVIEESGDLYGTTVNAAARIAAKARSGQVLVSETVKQDAAGDWSFIDRGLFWLKGLRERWTLYEATRAPDTVHAASLDGRSPFIDREDERAALRVYVDAARDGRGGFVLLAGEAGAGKTRLAEEIAVEASGRGMRLLVGRCYEATQTQPFTPFIDILQTVERAVSPETFRVMLGEAAGEIARLIPHIRRRYPDVPAPADLPDPDQARRYLFSSIRDVLAGMGRSRPLFLLLDDVHWADEQTLLLLEQLGDELNNLPILVVGTYIEAELTTARPLRATIEKLHRRHLVERIRVGPLSEDDLRVLLEAIVGKEPPTAFVKLLYHETEGNVFFAEEVVWHMLEQDRVFDEHSHWRMDVEAFDLDVPETIRLTIGRRLDGLAETTKPLLTTAAVVGRAFGFELMEALSDMSEDELIDALDDAERARVITSTNEAGAVQFRFSHELIRQTLVGSVSLTRRQLLHQRIGEALERVHAGSLPEHASAVAYHLEQAGRRADPQHMLRFLVMAGERALEAAAYAEAARYLDRALALIGSDDPASRAPVLEKLGSAERSLGQLDDALSTWREALDAYDASSQPDAVARLSLDAGSQVAFWLRGRDVLELVDRGLRALGDSRQAVRGGLLALSGAVASQGGEYDRGEQLLEEALQVARSHDDERILGLALYSRAAHHFAYSEFPRAVEFAHESAVHLRHTSDLWNLANALAYSANSLVWMGHFEDAEAEGKDAEELALRVGSWSAWAFANKAQTAPAFGRNPDLNWYEEDGRYALELGRQQGFQWLTAVGTVRMGLASLWLGRWDEALSRFVEALTIEGWRALGYVGRVFLTHAYLGNREAALDLIEKARPEFPVLGKANTTQCWGVGLMAAEAFAMLGEDEQAAALYPMVLEAIAAGSLARGLDMRLLATLAGVTAGCARRFDAAEAHFYEALRLARDLPMRLEEPEACRFYAKMLIDRGEPGDSERASDHLAHATELYRQFGMARHEELARSLAGQIA